MYSPAIVYSSQSVVKKRAVPQSPSTPSTVKQPTGLELFKSVSDSFVEQIDIQLRATLYSLTAGDTKDVKSTLQHMRIAVKDFHTQSDSAYNKAKLQASAASQKISHLQQYTSNLSTLKNNLELKVKSFEQQLADVMKEEMPDDSIFNEDFEDSDPVSEEDELLRKKKKGDPQGDTANAD